MKTVAILCASQHSEYRKIPGVEIYDIKRDVFSFTGGMPVIAHPPCRAWSKFCKHQAKPMPNEKDIGLFCAQKVWECGGILEQPAFSLLFAAANLPLPGSIISKTSWSTCVWQAWWGYPTKKATWLYFRGIPPQTVHYPFRLHPVGMDGYIFSHMSHLQRSHTTENFANWLVSLARRIK